ncbi:telomere stability and silencing-domain-containing protein [Chytridium lagenaria]|nr:telomere stability and silencing-domain-containing protein [Chytridium lagenaria]
MAPNCKNESHDEPLRLRGGKGGFGSMLRAQGGKMASKKTTNFEACRDLSGRRLKTVNDAKKLAEFLEKEPERKKRKLEAVKEKIDKAMQEPKAKKIRFDDTKYAEDHSKVLDTVKETISKVAMKKKNVLKVTKRKVASWEEESSSEEDDKKA